VTRFRNIIGKENTKNISRKLTIFFILFVLLFVFGTITVMIIKGYSISASITYTVEALAFIFHDETGLAKSFEMFMAIFGVFLLWWILWSLFDIIIETDFVEYVRDIKIRQRLKKMKDHYVIVGGGVVGDELANRLRFEKKQLLIVEKDKARVDFLKSEGFNVIYGDITYPEILKKTKIEDAKVLIIAIPETERVLLITLIAKELNPKLDILARADNPDYVSMIQKAGARKVIVPEITAVEQFMADLKTI
jgi:voltage-gated potassium channel